MMWIEKETENHDNWRIRSSLKYVEIVCGKLNQKSGKERGAHNHHKTPKSYT